MPIERISATQFRERLRRGITARDSTQDVGYGPIRDVVIDPAASVFETQNDRIRQVSLLLSLVNDGSFSDADLEALVFNEGLTRLPGARATGNVAFSRGNVLASGSPNVKIPRGFPLSTLPDGGTDSTATFVTTVTVDIAPNAMGYNGETDRYEVSVPVISVVGGATGQVGANRITQALRPLPFGVETVTNPTPTTGGRDIETNDELIERYLLSIVGRDIVTPQGIERVARATFPAVEDVLAVFGGDPLLTRDIESSGAVDAYIVGESILTRIESVPYVGPNQLMPISSPPLRDIVLVDAGAFSEGVDYEVIRDTSEVSGSTRATEGIRFIGSAPTPGDLVAIEYTSNDLITLLQTVSESGSLRRGLAKL